MLSMPEVIERSGGSELEFLAEGYRREFGVSIELPIPGKKTDVSIVIPAYNEGGTIRRTLESLNRQTRGGFEVIVVDNGSTDETAVAVRKFAGTSAMFPLYLLEESKRGPGHARRRGMDQAAIRQAADRGVKYIVGTDADSIPEPAWIDGVVKSFEETEADLLIGGIFYYRNIVDPRFQLLHYLDAVRFVTSKKIMPRLRGINFAVAASAYMRAKGITQPYRSDGVWSPGEEYTLWRGIDSFNGKVAYMDTLVDGDPRRFLDNMVKGKAAGISLYGGVDPKIKIADVRTGDMTDLLDRVSDKDVTHFVGRQLKNIFWADVLGVAGKPEQKRYWPVVRTLLGNRAEEFEAEFASGRTELDYLWDKYGEEFVKQINRLIEEEGISLQKKYE